MKPQRMRKVIVLSFGALLGLVLMLKTRLNLAPVQAANLVVTSPVDGTLHSLRDVITLAQDGDTITFDTGSTGPAITLTLGPITVTRSITISGRGASNLRISGGSSGPIFDTAVGSKPGAKISGLKLAGTTNTGFGGAIYNTGILSIDNCVISGNTADFGGGIHNQGGVITIDACTITQNTANAGGALSNQGGTVTVNNSTISSNTATSQNGGGITTFGSDCPSSSGTEAFLFVNNSTLTGNSVQGNGLGGGLCNSLSGFAQLVNCTVTSNSSPIAGGGIDTNSCAITFVISCTVTGNTCGTGAVGAGGVDNLSAEPGTVTLYNNIIAGNTGLGDCNGSLVNGVPTVTSGGHNLIQSPTFGFPAAASDIIGLDPLLLPLADNGGPTQTQALSCGSPALDAGDDSALGLSTFLTGDQRGLPRKAGVHVDIGAYELQIQMTPAALPGGAAGVFYSQTLTATGGDAPYSFFVAAGMLPNNLQLTDNVLSGIPTQGGNFTFTIEAQDKTGAALCVTYTLNICTNITASISGDQSMCPPGPGATVTVAINISGGSPPYNVFVTDGGGLAIGTTFSQPNQQMLLPAPSQTTTFTLKSVMDASGCSATSLTGSAAITVNQPPSVTTNPQSMTLCQGMTVSFSAAATGSPAPSVQWQFNTRPGAAFTNIPGATSTTLSFAADPTQSGHNFRAVFTNACGTAATQAATLTVNTAPSVTTNPQNTTACARSPVSFGAAASGRPAPSIQWQGSTDGGSTFADIPGATTSTLTLSPGTSQDGVKFRAVFTNTCGSANSQSATLMVNLVPTVKTNPLDVTVCEGIAISFTAAATGSPAPTVQWQVSTGGGATYSNIPGATAATLSLTADASHNGYNYRTVFTNTCGTATSQPAILTVNTAPVVTSSPLGVSAMAGTSVSFSAGAAGSPAPSVQWQVSTDGGSTFVNLPGAVSATLTLTVTAGMSGYQYRAVFTNTCGTATTQPATLNAFDKCLKDDNSGNFIQFNSQTGDYLLTVCGSSGFTFSGKGTVKVSGSVVMITDSRTDRRVTISYLTNQLTGNATISIAIAPGVFKTIRISQTRTSVVCACA
jgi:hypothetical protein